MKSKLFFSMTVIAAMITVQTAKAQTRMVEDVKAQEREVVIPYKKFVLDNGLTLIVHEDNSDPVVHVDVTYHVGSAREELGKSGFAHFFEHMMFQGSDNVGDEQHFKIVSEAGGSLNGTTNRDRTNYFETLPKNYLETALWLESDRMGFLLDAVTQEKFEVQRATVKNEKGQRYDNQPYGLSREFLAKTLYPYGHPYSWLTIGYVEDLDRVNLQDLKNFFMRWYGPNNATLTVGGDVNTDEVVRLAEQYFGPIQRGPEVKDMELVAPKLEKDRYIYYEDEVRFPLLQMVYPTVPNYHPDEAPLDFLAEVLGSGKNSVFYQEFVKPQKALQVSASNPCYELAGEFTISAVPYPGKTLTEMESEVREVLQNFDPNTITDDQLERFRTKYESQMIFGLESVSAKVSQLAAYQTFLNNPNYTTENLERYRKVTKADVVRVYNQYIKGQNAVVLSVVPKGKVELAAKEEKYTVSQDGHNAKESDYRGLRYVKPRDDFDRSRQPAATEAPLVNIPPVWRDKFGNGMQLIGTESNDLPIVTLQINIEGGHLMDDKYPGKAGLAVIAAQMMNEDTENMTSEEMAAELERLGASISVYANRDNTVVRVRTLKKNIDGTLALLEEKLMRPKFRQEDFDRLKKQQLEAIENQSTQPGTIAANVFNKILYGKDHIFSVPTSGVVQSVESIKLADVKTFYKENMSPSLADVVVVGDVGHEEIIAKLTFLKEWAALSVEVPALPETKKVDKTVIYLVDKKSSAQSELRMGYIAMPYDATGEHYRAGLMNFNLGGAFNSRINLNLREDKGYTYGARSGFSGDKNTGMFVASASVRSDVTDSSIVEFVKEMTNYREAGISEDDLNFLKMAVGQGDARKYETSFQKAGFLGRLIEYDLTEDFVKTQNQILENLTVEEVNALAGKHINPDKMAILVVGDKETVLPGLQKLNYEIIELDSHGNPVSAKPEVEKQEKLNKG